YEQDKPSFWEKYAEVMGLSLSVMMLLVSGMWHLKMRLQGKQKNHADMYNLEILKLIEQINSLEELEKLQELRQELFNIFTQVVIDLDKDLITPESFQSFTFTWEVALSSIRHQELLLNNISTPEKLTNKNSS
ncbi:MAG: C4-dicarboxylate ABC transporter substrate-binding protein, partial [Xenococcus sp. (in: cyanobacteria)]